MNASRDAAAIYEHWFANHTTIASVARKSVEKPLNQKILKVTQPSAPKWHPHNRLVFRKLSRAFPNIVVFNVIGEDCT